MDGRMKAEEPRPEVRLTGIAAAPGVARGPAYPLMRGMAIVACEKVADPEAEIRRLEGALAATRVEIAQLREAVTTRNGDTATIDGAAEVQAGGGDPLLMDSFRTTFYDAHTHLAAGVPTGPPQVLPSAGASTVIKGA
jgi:phosphoenolpyruvate-protein kinase (PTS system EI component)